MYEVRVTAHEFESKRVNYISIIKMFRMVTKFGLKESKDAVESMIGKGPWLSDGFKDGKYESIPRVPFVFKCPTFIRAMQVKIEFTNGGFTAEVVEVNGQGS